MSFVLARMFVLDYVSDLVAVFYSFYDLGYNVSSELLVIVALYEV